MDASFRLSKERQRLRNTKLGDFRIAAEVRGNFPRSEGYPGLVVVDCPYQKKRQPSGDSCVGFDGWKRKVKYLLYSNHVVLLDGRKATQLLTDNRMYADYVWRSISSLLMLLRESLPPPASNESLGVVSVNLCCWCENDLRDTYSTVLFLSLLPGRAMETVSVNAAVC